MHDGWRVAGLTAGLVMAAATAVCGSSAGASAVAGPPSANSASSAASVAATAAPGTYGSPVDPSLPNPTDVATDTAAGATTTGPSGAAEVVVTYSGWTDATAAVEFGAYVAGVAESGGRCVLTLTSASESARAEVPAEAESASTSCPNMLIPGSELSPGSWQAVVSYESPSVSGASAPLEVVVP